jgi:hypothetical protein
MYTCNYKDNNNDLFFLKLLIRQEFYILLTFHLNINSGLLPTMGNVPTKLHTRWFTSSQVNDQTRITGCIDHPTHNMNYDAHFY